MPKFNTDAETVQSQESPEPNASESGSQRLSVEDWQARVAVLTPELNAMMTRDKFRVQKELERWEKRPPRVREADGAIKRLQDQIRTSNRILAKRLESLPAIIYPETLPVSQRRDEIIELIAKHQVVILAGETGSGKTTQLPKICLEAGRGIIGKIGCTQPRRVAALSIAKRIADELKVQYGREVGSKIRFQDQTRPESYIKLMTDGILLAEVQGDPLLSEYDTILVDEAHERSLNIDFLLGHLKQILPKRPDLKVVITSATIDTQSFSEAFGGAPILEISGRVYPVEVEYFPINHDIEEAGEISYVDGAVDAVEVILEESGGARGDVLIFMPGEGDIRETRDLLEGRNLPNVEIVPLFGRLSSSDQERVFSESRRRKIIIATNIAETSLTIPGIRYVIDTGLARMSRYSPKTRTQRLPIEPVSQSSANQRAGRSGRMENGVCIRLYSEEEYDARPKFTQPEIQRCNLAEVILRMKAFNIGEIETFPFINPPQPKAIQSGYQLLQELGALDDQRELTEVGAKLARIPIDPTIGRMALQAIEEKALNEVAVIAAGLSVQDPRERPMDKQKEADGAHSRFRDPDSDFITLLNIWNAYHDTWETLKTQNQLRKFCKSHFLSYSRMREWRDIHKQILGAIKDLKLDQSQAGPATYEAIHRSVLTGLLGQVGAKDERNHYKVSSARRAMLFPGSGLFDRNVKKSRKQKAKEEAEAEKGAPTDKSETPKWVMAGELVETSALYLRTVARIEPEWIIELGRHACKISYQEPRWDVKSQRVLVRERVVLHGVEVSAKWVPYGPVQPKLATELFIRGALIEDTLRANPRFLENNRQVLNKIENWQTRTRHYELGNLEQVLFDFYSERLEKVSSLHDLNSEIRNRSKSDPDFLCLTEEILTSGLEIEWDPAAFPDQAKIGDVVAPLNYVYAPGEATDGVTVRLPVEVARSVNAGAMDWVTPGYWRDQVEALLRGLPKNLRRPLTPIHQTVAALVPDLRPSDRSLKECLADLIRRRYGVVIEPSDWVGVETPDYLKLRFEITDKQGKTLKEGRDLDVLIEELKQAEVTGTAAIWNRVASKWEKDALTSWSFGDLPERVQVTEVSGAPVYGYPGVAVQEEYVCVRLFKSAQESRAASRRGVKRLLEMELERDLGWLWKDLKKVEKMGLDLLVIGSSEVVRQQAFENARKHLLDVQLPAALTSVYFNQLVAASRRKIPGLADELQKRISRILEERSKLMSIRDPYPGLSGDLNTLAPADFLKRMSFERLAELPRYLAAMRIRSERASVNPSKDREKLARLRPALDRYQSILEKWNNRPARQTMEMYEQIDLARWMIEEWKVILFAQELKSAIPVSDEKVRNKLDTVYLSL